MAQLREIAESKRDMFRIAVDQIHIDPRYNIRDLGTPEATDALEILAANIKESGLRVPLMVRMEDDLVVLVQGHRRLTAIQMLVARGEPIISVECFAESTRRDEAERTIDLFLSNEGEPLTEMEKAEGVRRLISYGWDQHKIAAKLGRSASYVSHLLALTSMPVSVQEMVRDGEVSAATALNTVRAVGASEATEVLHEAVDEARAAVQQPTLGNGEIVPETRAKATPKLVKEVTERKRSAKGTEPKPKKVGHTLGAVLTDRVVTFLTSIITHKYDDDDANERLENDAEKLLDAICREVAGM